MAVVLVTVSGLVAAAVVMLSLSGAPGATVTAQAPVSRLALPLLNQRASASAFPRPPTAVPTATDRTPTRAPTLTPARTGTPPTPTPSPLATVATTAPATHTTPVGTATPISCGNISTFEDGRFPTTEIHVATTGDDRAGDGSLGLPFATIGRAAQAARPGTAIRVHAGTYPGGAFVPDLRGREDAPIWLGGMPGEGRPIVDGGGQALHLVRPAWLIVHDLEVRGSTANGINADDGGDYADAEAAHHVVIRDLAIRDVGAGGNQDCLKLSGLRHVFVLRSTFRACGGGGSGSGIDIVGGHHALLAGNRMTDMSANAVQAKGGSTDIEVRGNHMTNAGQRAVNMGGSTGFEYFRPPLSATAPNAEARDIRVVANLIEGSDAPVAFVGCVECLVANNTLVNPAIWVLRILQETTTRDGIEFEPARDGRFVNNLVYFRRADLRSFVNVGANTATETFGFAHNLWFAHDDPSRSRPSLPVAEVGGVVGLDPLFAAGYQLSKDSPAVGAGLRVAGVRADAAGSCYADPPSIGAYEGRRE